MENFPAYNFLPEIGEKAKVIQFYYQDKPYIRFGVHTAHTNILKRIYNEFNLISNSFSSKNHSVAGMGKVQRYSTILGFFGISKTFWDVPEGCLNEEHLRNMSPYFPQNLTIRCYGKVIS